MLTLPQRDGIDGAFAARLVRSRVSSGGTRVARRTLIVLGVIAGGRRRRIRRHLRDLPRADPCQDRSWFHRFAAPRSKRRVARLSELGLRGKLADTVADPLTPAGTVAWQSPVAETVLPQGAHRPARCECVAPLWCPCPM